MNSNILTADMISVTFLPSGNRDIDPKHVNTIKQSIQTNGLHRGISVIKTKLFNKSNDKTARYYIADGQHLYTACKALGKLNELIVFVHPNEMKTINEIVRFVSMLNTTGKNWSINDFVTNYASTNNTNYIKLQNKLNTYGLGNTVTSIIYSGLGSSQAVKSIKDGRFTIIDELHGDRIAKLLQDVVLILGRQNSQPIQRFAYSMYFFINSISNESKFIKFVEKNREAFLTLNQTGLNALLQQYK